MSAKTLIRRRCGWVVPIADRCRLAARRLRRCSIHLPPPLVREMVERIAAFWRSRFEELLDECRVPAEAEVAA